MNRQKLYKIGLSLAVVALLSTNSFIQKGLNTDRKKLDLVRTDEVLENAPPALAFTTVALGGFRGLISNLLWVRANTLQEEGKYFEMIQLADWITKLQPHYVDVWRMQAWNMTYNISIKFPDPDSRYHWVMAGVELLRDEAIQLNPKEPALYHELARFFHHKMGDIMDFAHLRYKYNWAWEWQQFMGVKPDYEMLLNPQTEEQKALVEKLRTHYKMNPEWMQEVDDKYGPLEWRLPETHAIYWGYVGIKECGDEQAIDLRRMIYQGLLMAFQRGRIVENKYMKELNFVPNLEVIEILNKTYIEMMQASPDYAENIQNGHRNFLIQAIQNLYLANRRGQAQEWLDYAESLYGDSVKYSRNQTLDEFVIDNIGLDLSANDPDNYKALIMGYLGDAFFNLALEEEQAAMGLTKLAEGLQKRYLHEVTKPGKTNIIDARRLPSMKAMKIQVLRDMFRTNSGMPAEMQLRLASRFEPAQLKEVMGTNWGSFQTNVILRFNEAPSGSSSPSQETFDLSE